MHVPAVALITLYGRAFQGRDHATRLGARCRLAFEFGIPATDSIRPVCRFFLALTPSSLAYGIHHRTVARNSHTLFLSLILLQCSPSYHPYCSSHNPPSTLFSYTFVELVSTNNFLSNTRVSSAWCKDLLRSFIYSIEASVAISHNFAISQIPSSCIPT